MANILPLSQFLTANPLVGVLGFGQSDVLRRAPNDATAPPVMLERGLLPLAEPGPQVGVRQFPSATPPLMYDQASQNRAMDMIGGLIPPPQGALAQQDVPGMNQQDAPLIPDQPVPNMWANSPPVFPQGPMGQQPPIPQASMGPQPMTPQPAGPQPMGPQQRTFIEPAAQQVVQQGRRGMSDAAMWGLLSAGLGILQNNYGKYGQAGPAIGAGGMQGVNTFLGVRQQEVENQRRDMLAQQQGEYQRAQIEAQRANTELQGRRVDIEEQRERQKQLQELQSRQLALMLAGPDQEQQRIALANPDKYLDFKVAQLKPEYKERSIKDGTTARDEYSIDAGKTWNPVPGGGKYDLRAAKGGSETNLTMQGAAEDFNKQSLKEQATALVEQYKTLQNVPDQLAVMDEAEKALAAVGGFVGSGAEVKLGIAKFFNNNFGTDIGSNEVANAELLRSTLFRQIMDNLKKLDAQPSQQQQKVMQESLGNLTTDPKAIPQIIRITRDVLTSRAKAHNKRVRQAKENKAQFLYDITIPGFDEGKDPWEK